MFVKIFLSAEKQALIKKDAVREYGAITLTYVQLVTPPTNQLQPPPPTYRTTGLTHQKLQIDLNRTRTKTLATHDAKGANRGVLVHFQDHVRHINIDFEGAKPQYCTFGGYAMSKILITVVNGSLFGPTIRVRDGIILVIHVFNKSPGL
jgi:hypothetical protein